MAKKKSKENKQLLQLGSKQRAGRMLSTYLRAIADERTEVEDIAVSPDRVEHRIISKAEKLARDMFNIAMGKDCRIGDDSITITPITDAKLVLEYRKLILDRIDGRPGAGGADEEEAKDKIPDRISEINKKRINKIADGVVSGADG